jgi:hypothetical protein
MKLRISAHKKVSYTTMFLIQQCFIYNNVSTYNNINVSCTTMFHIQHYNIAFVNSERWLAKSRVDITQCQHGNVRKFLSLCFFVLYYKTNIKLFSVLIYSYINTRGNWENSKLCENTSPFGRRVSTQFLVFPISTRVDITVYQHGKCFIFVKCFIYIAYNNVSYTTMFHIYSLQQCFIYNDVSYI